MSTLTPNLGLTKPAGGEAADVAVLNANMDILDSAVTLAGSQTLTGKTLTVPHLTGPVVDSGGLSITSGGLTVTAGGLTITAGGLTVTAGNVGIGIGPITQAAVYIYGALMTTASQSGLFAQPTGSSAGTSALDGVVSQPSTAAAAFTCANVASFHSQNPIKGAGSTITSAYGLLVDSVTTGNTNNYGIYVAAPSGGATVNEALHVEGTTNLNGTTTLIGGNLTHTGSNLGVFGHGVVSKQTVSGAKGGNAALASVIAALSNYGFITDSSTA